MPTLSFRVRVLVAGCRASRVTDAVEPATGAVAGVEALRPVDPVVAELHRR